jgi:plastocyanin
MRPHRLLLLPLAALLALAGAAPATASTSIVDVTSNFTFAPPSKTIAVGDTVDWTWSDGGHTSTSNPSQPESWNSRLKDNGAIFSHTFTHPGRYQYVCVPHEDIGMKGTIVVGQDTVTDTVDAFKTRARGKGVTVSFTLNEAAVATYTLKGPTKKTVKRGRLKAGKHSLEVKRLKAGRYRGVLTLSDDFDKKTTQKKSFRIR